MSTTVSLKLLTDAVVASYIHDISTRHRPEQPSAEDQGISPSGDQRLSAAPDG
jgi:hypothetical protein